MNYVIEILAKIEYRNPQIHAKKKPDEIDVIKINSELLSHLTV